jgi:hypothetical protein
LDCRAPPAGNGASSVVQNSAGPPVKEMRLRESETSEQASRFLGNRFVSWWEKRFALAPPTSPGCRSAARAGAATRADSQCGRGAWSAATSSAALRCSA